MNLSKVSDTDLLIEIKTRKCCIFDTFIEPNEEFKILVRPDKEYIEKFQVNPPEVISQEWEERYFDRGFISVMAYCD